MAKVSKPKKPKTYKAKRPKKMTGVKKVKPRTVVLGQ